MRLGFLVKDSLCMTPFFPEIDWRTVSLKNFGVKSTSVHGGISLVCSCGAAGMGNLINSGGGR